MAQKDYQLAQDILNAFKVKSINPHAPGYVTKKYGWLNYDLLMFYARRFLPRELNHRFEKDEDYIKYVLEWQKSDPELIEYFTPDKTPTESDSFHENIAKDGREPTEEEKKEDQENKEKVEKAEAAGEEIVPEEEEPEEKAEEKVSEEATESEVAAAAEGAAAEEAAEKAEAAPAPETAPPTHAQKEAAKAEWMAHEEAPAKIPTPEPSKPPISKNALKRSPKPKFAVLNGRVVTLNQSPAGNQKPSATKQEVEKLRRITQESVNAAEARRNRQPQPPRIQTPPPPMSEPIVLSRPRRVFPRVRMPGAIKDLGNKLQISAKPVALFAIGGAAIGSLAGPVGVLVGAGAGVVTSRFFPTSDDGGPAFFGGASGGIDEEPGYGSENPQQGPRSPINNLARQGGSLTKDAAKRMGKQLAKEAAKRLAAAAAEAIAANPVAWAIAGGIAVFFLIFIILLQVPGSALCFPGRPCGIGAGGGGIVSTNPGNNSGSLMACTFTAGATGQQQVKIGNPDLAAFITDTADKVGIPPSVLAGILAIESSGSLSSTNPDYFNNDYDAHQSSAGAIGIAQFEPDTFSGYFNLDSDEIAQKFDKTEVDATIAPQVSPPPNDSTMRITSIKDSIIMAAFKLRDDKDAAGENEAWDNDMVTAVARAYQRGCDNNYCNNLVQSFNSCSSSNLAGGPRATPPPTNLPPAQAIQQEFGITFVGFDQYPDQLQWAREKLWDVSGTNLVKYVRGTTIHETGQTLSLTYCSGSSGEMQLHPWTNEEFFKFLLTHELGHVVQSCAGQGVVEHKYALSAEGYISYYAAHAPACNGIQPPNNNLEDYADMVAYYLNPNAGYSSAPVSCLPTNEVNPPNPYGGGGFAQHHSVVQSVLGSY